MTLTLSPSDIRYSQDSISNKFSDGNLLTSTFAKLISGQLSVTSLPTLECVSKDGYWYAASGNRRLFLYKKLQEAGALSSITVLKKHSFGRRNFTTKCSGVYVRCRGSMLEYDIKEIIAQWKRGENVVAKWGTAPVSPVALGFGRHRYDDFDFDAASDDDFDDFFGRLGLDDVYDYEYDGYNSDY